MYNIKDLRVDEVNRHTIAIFILVSKEIKQLLIIIILIKDKIFQK